ncbi:hypothetical protein [Mycolicibacterium houstonense]|uniref:hypothetical protein n=1 Tax=Mycolicibacterium houstonense TaxID=146021 RepID=UPI000938B37B|nr:hypothetical protein [Mycolicibacterium houstonense]
MNAIKQTHLSFLGILFIGASLFGACWTVIWLIRGSPLIAVIAFGAALCSFDVGFQTIYALSGRARPRTEYGSGGTLIQPQKCVNVVFCVGSIAGVSAATLYLALTALGMDSDISSWIIQRTAPLISVFVLIFGGWGLYGMLRYGCESHLRLTPDGFEIWSGHWCVSVHRKWEEVEQISDHLPRGRRIRRDMIVFSLPEGRNAMLVSDTITANSRALREWARFYWQHPECRAELTDGRAVHRLDEQNFTD